MDNDHSLGDVLLFTFLGLLGLAFIVYGFPQKEPDVFLIGLCCAPFLVPSWVNWRARIRRHRQSRRS